MRKQFVAGGFMVAAVAATVVSAAAISAPRAATVKFPDARLKIEYNATDGDAGLQVLLDAPPWREITITNPAGRRLVHVTADDVIRDYGLTELFSESSEPPFEEFPFEQFKSLFPEGRYTFTGETVDGQRLRSTFTLTHDVPDGPVITSPAEDATIAPDELVVRWQPDATPNVDVDVDVVAYEVIVVADDPFVGNPERTLDVMLPAAATSFPVPAEFLLPGAYKTEVLAIDDGGNQTLTEVAFTVE
jgi:hypothetical protein